ncbi:enoyl-CoA hydratase/isomerase [Chloropicon roscoffensis]|uniref:Enoyl-CoA hydratase/isomerase n=1 Tax=Chloropicon roscoffensis TaxID=1461544 RepID=A0AAX4PDW8_9CHLO
MIDEANFEVTRSDDNLVGFIAFNRPKRGNAVNLDMWRQLPEIVRQLEKDVKVIVLRGLGKHFCTGIDLDVLNTITTLDGNKVEDALKFRDLVLMMQESITSLERCTVPVIAAVHGCCYGAGIDIITACDIRYSTQDAVFSVKEVDVGLAADLGTLQRLPKIVGDGVARELCLTARDFGGEEARHAHLVTRTFPDHKSLMRGCCDLAHSIANKDEFAVQGTKHILLHARENSTESALNYVAVWNTALLKKEQILRQLAKRKRGGGAKAPKSKL